MRTAEALNFLERIKAAGGCKGWQHYLDRPVEARLLSRQYQVWQDRSLKEYYKAVAAAIAAGLAVPDAVSEEHRRRVKD